MEQTVVLLASEGYGVGKSTTSQLLTKELSKYTISSSNYSFSHYIKHFLGHIYNNCLDSLLEPSFTEAYSKNNTIKNYPLSDNFNTADLTFPNIVLRGAVNKFSDSIQDIFGNDIWAKLNLKSILKSDKDVIIFDDFRRPIEFNLIKDKHKTLTVYLQKDDINNNDSSYEGLLADFNFDLRFKFNSDWSNVDSLLEQIMDNI